ncbi:ATP-binding protein [Acinetobacter sp. A3.8]|uniref:histidine kinase n=1 Tax=Acinetobacter sedimenti TaxID=2919922 RepID=A0A9X2B5V8_9GAMM|nr:ATP-binding protein [Acinetobacter sedimenti]MCJ8145432.1 ATP-binding protein [Acinetobacter sedimenti]
MSKLQELNKLETLKRLGASYTGYRLFLALGLLAILLVSMNDLIIGARHPKAYLVLSIAYVLICGMNFLTFRYKQKYLSQQLFVYLIIDYLHLSAILYLSTGPNIAIVLLFMMLVLAAVMLLSARKALIITLLSVIAVVYQQFFYSIFGDGNVAFFGTSSLITLVFLSTYAIARIGIRRLKFIESVATTQRSAIFQLQQINQNIIEQLETGFMVLDQQGMIISINRSAENLLQLPNDMLLRSKDLHHIDEKLLQEILRHKAQNYKGTFIYTADIGVELNIHYRPIITRNQTQQLTLFTIESMDKINQQVQRLKLASLGQLSASIAHEIRNPLSAISQANELLEDDIDDDLKSLTEMIDKQCKRINRIIEDTLNMSRQNQTVSEDIDLYPWLRSFIREDLMDVQKHLRLTIEAKTEIHFDPHQLRLVLINLIRNAIRHGHQHIPNSRIDIKAHRLGDYTMIDVIDQGTGVSSAQLQNLFEPFHSTAVNGTGLGLYLSKTFCEANHAHLKYIPQTQGACFRIECPLMED